MSFFIRTQLLSAALYLISINLVASGGSPRPVSPLPGTFFKTVRNADADLNLAASERKAKASICSCQILSMSSRNYQHNNVAVFAEKINSGSFSSGMDATREVIEKEKKHLRLMFYDKLKVVFRTSEVTDCKSLFNRLKEKNSSLVLYDILDADVVR
jgi:hypothetical protein